MAIFYLFLSFLFFPRIIADEIKIYENGSVHWIRDWEMEDVPIEKIIWDENKNQTIYVKNGIKNVLVAKNTEMKYIIDSPLTTTIGKLIKETKIEGCQQRGCNLTLRFGDGTILHSERIKKSIDKIKIDLGPGKSQ